LDGIIKTVQVHRIFAGSRVNERANAFSYMHAPAGKCMSPGTMTAPGGARTTSPLLFWKMAFGCALARATTQTAAAKNTAAPRDGMVWGGAARQRRQGHNQRRRHVKPQSGIRRPSIIETEDCQFTIQIIHTRISIWKASERARPVASAAAPSCVQRCLVPALEARKLSSFAELRGRLGEKGAPSKKRMKRRSGRSSQARRTATHVCRQDCSYLVAQQRLQGTHWAKQPGRVQEAVLY
jgi:hypothetical protein